MKVATSRSGAQGCGRGQLLTDCQHRPSQLTTKRMEQEVAMILDSTLHGLACLFSGQIDYPADDMAVTHAIQLTITIPPASCFSFAASRRGLAQKS